MGKKYVFLYDGHGWYLVLNSLPALNEYLDMIWNIRKEDLLRDMERIKKHLHPTSDIIYNCHVLAGAKGSTVWGEYQALKEKQYQGMTEMFLKEGILYVNSDGGYCPFLTETKNRYESETMEWPAFKEEDIRIKQWPGGTHWYAYIGPIQVKEFDVVKWDNEADARAAAMHYVKRKRRLQ